MSLRSTALRLAVLAAGGALAAVTATGPALAAPAPHPAPAAPHANAPARATAPTDAHQIYYGRVIARTGLLLRDAPNRGGSVVRSEPYGAIVPIYCKVVGENVDGNNLWYLLTDGTWAWGAARYIENIGEPPPYCTS